MVDLPLLRLFQRAIGVGRRVRAQTGISKNALSVSSVAVELATTVVGDLSHCRVLVVGAGEAGRLVTKAIRERGGKQITVASRTLEKASALATALGGKSVLLDNLTEELANADVVISSTAAPHLVLRLPMVKEAISTRPNRPLVIIDIAVPRDVDSRVKQIDNVFLYDINDFTNIIELNREQRRQEIQRVTKVIDDELEIFISRWRTYEIKPTIAALVTQAENIRQVQLNKTLKKLPRLSAEQQASLEAMTRSIVQKILHEPIQCLKRNTHKKESYTQVVNELFHLDKEKPN
jgi:glutamyl-tRNA reductase